MPFNVPLDSSPFLLRIFPWTSTSKFSVSELAFDGISLTIAKINDNIIEVALIPHTLEYTNLSRKEIGDSVNIETDIIGKYIYQFISENENYEDINSILINTLNNLGLS